jgi:hypothetical protein
MPQTFSSSPGDIRQQRQTASDHQCKEADIVAIQWCIPEQETMIELHQMATTPPHHLLIIAPVTWSARECSQIWAVREPLQRRW